jgi:hypothetical protein
LTFFPFRLAYLVKHQTKLFEALEQGFHAFKQLLAEVDELHQRVEDLERISATKAEVSSSEYFTKAQAMSYLGCKSTKLWELVQAGVIRTSQGVGRSSLYLRSDLDKILSNGKAARLAVKHWKQR